MTNFETQLLLNLSELEFDTSKELTVEEIKSHFKKLSLYYHPDVNGNEIFRDKQKKINNAREFLLENLDEVNRYIRKVNHTETEEDKAREESEREEKARHEFWEQQAKAKQAEAQAKQAQEKAHAEARAKQAEEEAQEAKRRAAEAEAAARQAEAAIQASRKKKKTTGLVIGIIAAVVIGIPLIVGIVMAFVDGFNEGMEKDRESIEVAEKEAKTKKIELTNLPDTVVKGAKIDWASYFVSYKDENGELIKVPLSESMITTNYDKYDELKVEINVNNGSVYLYHKFTVLEGTLISNADTLKDIALKPDGIYLLDADIDLSGTEWKPIENFTGSFLGNGHKIKNLTITSFSTKNVGLFATVGDKSTVSDLTLENVSIVSSSTAETVGAVVGSLKGTVKNITVTGKIESAGSNAVGGIVGATDSINSLIADCSFDGSVIGSTGVGGILGGKDDNGNATIERCTVKGSVSGTAGVGGIAGYVNSKRAKNHIITDCKNSASITAKVEYCGGIVGKLQNSTDGGSQVTTVTGCENNGEINGKECTAGIIGGMNLHGSMRRDATVNGNVNNGKVTGTDYTAGIIGYVNSDYTIAITSATNNNDIKGNAYVGGIVGWGEYTSVSGVTHEKNVTGSHHVGGIIGVGNSCTDCTNEGTVTATGSDTANDLTKKIEGVNGALTALGGIAGRTNTATNCTNEGNLISQSGYGVGGIVGANLFTTSDGAYSNCSNTGNITVTNGVTGGLGGILGIYANFGVRDTKLSITGCKNSGVITTSTGTDVGGIAGYCKTNDKTTIISCLSTGAITADNCTYVGGIAGSILGDAPKIETVTVLGPIKGKAPIGSVIGYTSKEPDNYSTVKETYEISKGILISHIGQIAG